MLISQNKNSKGFIQIPILIAIIAGVLVLGGAGYFGVKQYQNYQLQKTKELEFSKQDKEKKNLDILFNSFILCAKSLYMMKIVKTNNIKAHAI
jgi:flagellar basal body-associated protein FliL